MKYTQYWWRLTEAVKINQSINISTMLTEWEPNAAVWITNLFTIYSAHPQWNQYVHIDHCHIECAKGYHPLQHYVLDKWEFSVKDLICFATHSAVWHQTTLHLSTSCSGDVLWWTHLIQPLLYLVESGSVSDQFDGLNIVKEPHLHRYNTATERSYSLLD